MTAGVTVIVPVYNDAARLGRCLDALGAQAYGGPVEVLVVDNGSTDRVAEVAAGRRDVRLLQEPRPGSYAARNLGLREASHAMLAFTDADCLPEPGWLAAGVGRLLAEGDGVGLVGGAIELFPADPRRLTWAEAYEAAHGFPQQDYVERRHFSPTANLFTTRAVVQRVGPFDDRLRSGGDQEWGQRVHAAGLGTVYEPRAVVRHPMRRRLPELAEKARRTVGGQRDRNELDRYFASRATFWPYVLKHYWGPWRRLPELRRTARERGVPAGKLFGATLYRQGARARELVRLWRGHASRR